MHSACASQRKLFPDLRFITKYEFTFMRLSEISDKVHDHVAICLLLKEAPMKRIHVDVLKSLVFCKKPVRPKRKLIAQLRDVTPFPKNR